MYRSDNTKGSGSRRAPGSGAVFFDLWARGALATRRVVLSDANADLIAMYLRLADSTNAPVLARWCRHRAQCYAL